MGFRFYKSLRVLPGIRLNVSKSGFSWSIGPRGANVNVGPRGRRYTVGLPGSGLSYVRTAGRRRNGTTVRGDGYDRPGRRSRTGTWLPLTAVIVFVMLLVLFS